MNRLSVKKYMTPNPHSIRVDESLKTADAMMTKLGVRHLPVLRAGELVGVLSERDVRLYAGAKAGLGAFRVEDACVDEPLAVDLDTSLCVVARAMADKKLGSVLVLDEGRVVGVLTTTDACRALADLLEE